MSSVSSRCLLCITTSSMHTTSDSVTCLGYRTLLLQYTGVRMHTSAGGSSRITPSAAMGPVSSRKKARPATHLHCLSLHHSPPACIYMQASKQWLHELPSQGCLRLV
jgi:hypothetical protein